MNIDPKNHRLSEGRFILSPNCSERPPGVTIDLLVIHNISLPPGEFGNDYIEALFCNRLDPKAHPYFAKIADLRVSSHVVVSREGELVQYVPFNRCAWHAGESSFQGRFHCNDFSIGIELEGTDNIAYTSIQYQCLCAVTKVLIQAYPNIKPEHIVGHSDIAPGRKTDPGKTFDWRYYRSLLAKEGL